MIVRSTPRAERDLERILRTISDKSPQGARRVALKLQEAFRFLADAPHGGIRTQKPGVFVKFVARYPYKVFYRLTEDAVEILHVRHAARRPWRG